jgi:hypothetical protein
MGALGVRRPRPGLPRPLPLKATSPPKANTAAPSVAKRTKAVDYPRQEEASEDENAAPPREEDEEDEGDEEDAPAVKRPRAAATRGTVGRVRVIALSSDGPDDDDDDEEEDTPLGQVRL